MANIILICSLAAFGLIFVILLFLAGGYFWWRHKRSQLQFVEPNDDDESVADSINLPHTVVQVNPEPKSEEKAPCLLKINGLFNLKAPLIKINPPPSICSDGSPARNNDDGEIYIEGDNEEYVGQIHFSVEYDYQNTTLVLKVLQGKELPAKDLSGTSDPYVKVTLLPDKKHRLETKIKRRTLNPRWNETFYFEGFSTQKLQSRVIHLHVFDYDRFSRDDSIGEVFMPVCQVDLSRKQTFWKNLKSPASDKCGEILISLCYQPSNSVLTLSLIRARNLKAKDINGKSDPYVKVWLLFGDKRVEKRKTPIFKCTLRPKFNETFEFDVPWEKIRECSLDVMVMDFDNIGRNELIGKIILAGKNGSGASETKHWQDMILKPKQTILQWHRLKPE